MNETKRFKILRIMLLRKNRCIILVFGQNIFAPILTHSEKQVFGVECKIFTIAGPVILYGILASWVFEVIYWVGGVMGVI